jgi:nitroreductase
MEVLEAIKTRRSIRKYTTDPVDDQTLEMVLEAARWAPSWANTQCWRFVVVQDSATKSKLADTLNETNPARDAIRNAPLVIAACAELSKAGLKEGEIVTDKGDWFMFDVALAMQNLVLAAHSLGLGTVYVGRFDAKEAAKILGLPEGYCSVALTPLGYPAETKDPRPRKELSEIVFHDRWGH